MYRKVFVLLCVCILHIEQSQQQEECDAPFDLTIEHDDDDSKYFAFMNELEMLTFNVSEECNDPESIKELIWEYRWVLFEKYAEDMQNCHCAKIEAEFLNCTDIVWEMIKVDIQIKKAEFYGYCGKDYESLHKEMYTKIGYS